MLSQKASMATMEPPPSKLAIRLWIHSKSRSIRYNLRIPPR